MLSFSKYSLGVPMFVLCCLLWFASQQAFAQQAEKRNGPAATSEHAFYVGVDVCRECHQGATGKDSFSVWYASAHARAYAALARPEAEEIARLSGIDVNAFESPICLGCHSTATNVEPWEREETFSLEDGVQCEYCHGPGSEYMAAEIMVNREAATKAGLLIPGEKLCLMCHRDKGSHQAVLKVEPFNYQTFLARIAHSTTAETALMVTGNNGKGFSRKERLARLQRAKNQSARADVKTLEYKTPTNLALTSDGKRLFVACEASDSLIIIDTQNHSVIKEIELQNQPNDLCLSPDETRVYISNRGSDSVSVVDSDKGVLLDTIQVGDEPHGLITDAAGKTLYVANGGSGDVSLVDLSTGKETRRLIAGRGPWGVSRSADDSSILVTNNLSHFVKFRTSSRSEVTVIDTEKAQVSERITIADANLVQGVDMAPNGDFALVTLLRTKNLVPITRVVNGGVLTNGIGILWKDGQVDQLLLDEPGHYFADPTDLVMTPDGNLAYVSGGGVNEVAVLDVKQLRKVIARSNQRERKQILPNHLGIADEIVIKRIKVGTAPRGLVASSDGRFIYVADALDDTVSVIEVKENKRTAVIDLAGPKEISLRRFGERVFHSAANAFGQQFSCHSCHPDGGVDSITYDLEPDGLGLNPVDNRSLRGILDTAPFKWTGKNPSLSRQCGPRLAVFFTRIDPFTPQQVTALENYICTIPRNPNRYRAKGELSEAQRRGKKIFGRSMTNAGKLIPPEDRCSNCHSGPYYSNRQLVDVGTMSHLDTRGIFDVPHLTNIYETAPYLHDGRSTTLEEMWTRFNPEDKHGVTNDMTKNQLNDLIEYLKTL